MNEPNSPNRLAQHSLVEALSTSEHRYRQLLDSLSEVVFCLDAADYFTLLNRAWYEHSGLSVDSCLGQELRQFMPETEYQRWQSLHQNGDFCAEFQFYTADRTLTWFEVTYSPFEVGGYGTMLNIQDRKQSKLALEHSELKFQNIVENIAEILFQIDRNLQLQFLNPAWQAISGFTVAEGLGNSILDYIAPQQHAAILDALMATQAGKTVQLELQLICKDGSHHWVAMNAQYVKFNQTITGALMDIHQLKLVEQTLKLSEERFKLLAASTTDGIWDWDLDTDRVFYSPRWKEMLGYQDHELENCLSTWQVRVHPDDIQSAMDQVKACLEGHKPMYENIHRMLHRDGHWVWILDRGIALRDAQGIPYRMIGSHADISLLKSTEAALQSREQILDAIINICPDGIVSICQDNVIQSVNPAFCAMLGIDAEHLTGMSEFELEQLLETLSNQQTPKALLGHEDQIKFCLDLAKLRSHPLFNAATYSNRLARENKSPKIKAISRTVRQLKKDRIAKVWYFRDISIETEVDQMKSHFLSTAAHELRTPMASIYGFSELFLSRQLDSETQYEIIDTIHQQSKCLVEMLNQLLDLARIESRMGLDFCFERQALLPLVSRTITDLLVPGDPRQVNFDPGDKEFMVEVDGEKIKQVISNILVNAYKYSPQDSPIEVSLVENPAADCGKQEVGIRIVDHGYGMSPEELTHIFERFWRAADRRNIPGTGLGMSLVKEIIDVHQGRIEIQSQLDQGTNVTLWLNQKITP